MRTAVVGGDAGVVVGDLVLVAARFDGVAAVEAGGAVVGDDVETTTIETGGGPSVTIPDQALALTVATFFAMTSTLGLGYFFMKYGGDYEQS